MFIGKISKWRYVLKPSRQFYDVEASALDPDVLRQIAKNAQEYEDIQLYLHEVYDRLSQTGAADVKSLEVPLCLKSAPATKPKSTSSSKKRKSSSSTRKKASNSGSQSTGGTSV